MNDTPTTDTPAKAEEKFAEDKKLSAEDLFAAMPYAKRGMAEDMRFRYLATMKDGSIQALRARSALEAYKLLPNRDDVLHVKRELLDTLSMVEKKRVTEIAQDRDLPVFNSQHKLVGLEDFDALGINIQELSDLLGDDEYVPDEPPAAEAAAEAPAQETEEAPKPDVLEPEETLKGASEPAETPAEATAEAAAEPASEATPADSPKELTQEEKDGLSPEEIERLLNG